MKKSNVISLLLLLFVLSLTKHLFSQNVGIGTTTPSSSARLDITSTNSGFLPPRMTTAQRDAIANPAPGLMIFNTSTQAIEFFTVYGWSKMKSVSPGSNKLIGGAFTEYAQSIRNTSDGGYIVAAYSNSSANGDVTATNHSIGYDYWIIKLDHYGNISWNKLLGGNSNEIAYDIQPTSDGGYIVAGSSQSTASGDVTGTNHGSSEDYWIVKLNAAGNITWNKLLGGNASDEAYSIQQTSDGGYIVAGYSYSSANGDVTGINHGAAQRDYWIVRLDSGGNISWNKLLGGSSEDIVSGIQQTTDGGYIVAGYSNSSANGNVTGTNHGDVDCWVVKLDGSGNITWNKLIGGNMFDYAYTIQQTSDGGYILAGSSATSQNGDVTSTIHGGSDFLIFKLDAAGNISWNKLLGGNAGEAAYSIQQTTDGGYIVAGTSSSSVSGNVSGANRGNDDGWIVKLDASGNITWNKLFGGNNYEGINSIRQTPDGGFIVAGYSNSSANNDVTEANHGGYDCWIIRLDANGNIL